MKSNNKTIKFFISSTFKDFEQERDILHKFVFPKLKDLCHANGFGFQPIDLRWGVMEEAGVDQQTMNICLNEIKRSSYKPKPNLLLLVGQRYGWVPLPYSIEEKEFDEILKKIKKQTDKSGLYIQNYPSQLATIKEWYILDENAIPNTYYLKDKFEFKDNRDGWSQIENIIKDTFQNATKDEKGKIPKKYNRFHTSATEQEMDEGLDAVNNEHTFAYFRTITDYEKVDIKKRKDFIDSDLTKLDDLSEKLRKNSNIPKKNQIISEKNVVWKDIEEATKTKYEELTLGNCQPYLKEFYNEILTKFTTAIQDEIEEFENRLLFKLKKLKWSIKATLTLADYQHQHHEFNIDRNKKITELEIELDEQGKFLEKKSKIVIGRDTEVKRILDFITKDKDKQYYLQHGKSGSGKTSVMAKAINDVDKIKYEIVYRFIGTSALSTYSRVLFESIYWQIQTKLDNNDKLKKETLNLEHDEYKFKEQFKEQLQKLVEKDKKVVIFLDALDQFEDYNDLTILLEELPENVKIVFSTLYDKSKVNKLDEDYYRYYNRLEYLDKNKKNSLKELDKEYSHEILKKWLETQNRTLTYTQYKDIRKLTDNKTPLYLKLVFEMVKHYTVDEKVEKLEKDEKELILQFFNFIQIKYHHEKSLVKYTLGLISASKDGLSEEELIDLFSRDETFLNQFQNDRYQKLDRLPPAIWSRFYYYIEEFFTEKLIDGEMLINPFHRVIAETIKEEYYKKESVSLHKKLAGYFLTLQDNKKVWDKRYNNLHMLSETPYQLFKSKKGRCLKKILFDLEFAGSIYNNHKQESFREIMEKATELKEITDDDIYVWESFYREKEHLITKVDEKMWRPHQSLFQLAYEDGKESQISERADKLLQNKKVDFYWLKRVNMKENYYRSGLDKIFTKEVMYTEELIELQNGNFVTYSESTLYIWNNLGQLNKVIKTHTADINGILELSNGNFLSYSEDAKIIIWDCLGNKYKTMDKHSKKASILKVIEVENMIVSISSTEYHLYLWKINGIFIQKMKGHTKKIIDIKYMHNLIISYSYDNTLRLWNIQDLSSTVRKKFVSEIINVLEFKDNTIATISFDKILTVFPKNRQPIELEHDQYIDTAINLSNGKIITQTGNSIYIWNIDDSQGTPIDIIDNLILNENLENIIALDKNRFLAYGSNGTIIIRDGNNNISLKQHSKRVIGVTQLKDGRIMSYSEDALICIWHSDGYLLQIKIGHDKPVKFAKELRNQKIISLAGNSIRIWKNQKNEFYNYTNIHEGNIIDIEQLQSNEFISYAVDKTIHILNEFGDLTYNLKIGLIKNIIKLSKNNILLFTNKKICLFSNWKYQNCFSHENSIDILILNNYILTYSRQKIILWNLEGQKLVSNDTFQYIENIQILNNDTIAVLDSGKKGIILLNNSSLEDDKIIIVNNFLNNFTVFTNNQIIGYLYNEIYIYKHMDKESIIENYKFDSDIMMIEKFNTSSLLIEFENNKLLLFDFQTKKVNTIQKDKNLPYRLSQDNITALTANKNYVAIGVSMFIKIYQYYNSDKKQIAAVTKNNTKINTLLKFSLYRIRNFKNAPIQYYKN